MEIISKHLGSNDIIKVLRIRSFLFLMLAEFFTQIAYNMANFVIMFLIYDLQKSNSAVSGVILSFTVPAVILSVLAGVLVDRWNKRNVLFATTAIRALLLLSFLISSLPVATMFGLVFLISVATQFFIPAEAPVIPLIVKEKRLSVPANAIFAIGIYVTVFIGYILSGPALLYFGRFTTFLILSILYGLGAILILFINVKEKKKIADEAIETEVERSIAKEFKQVISFISQNKKVFRSIILLTFSQTLIFTFAALGPGYLSEILAVQVENLSLLLLAPAATGMIIGSLILGTLSKKIKMKNAITAGFLIAGAIFIFLPFGSRVEGSHAAKTLNVYLPYIFNINILHIVIVLAFLGGVANALIYVPSNSTIQTTTTAELRGRVYGFLNAMVGAISLIPVAAAGGLADIFGVARVIMTIGIITFLIGILRLIFD